MEKQVSPPEFGSNGAVLNTGTMSGDIKARYERATHENAAGLHPQTWPVPALALMIAGAFTTGIAFGMDRFEHQQDPVGIIPILGVAAMFTAQVWQFIWNKKRSNRQ